MYITFQRTANDFEMSGKSGEDAPLGASSIYVCPWESRLCALNLVSFFIKRCHIAPRFVRTNEMFWCFGVTLQAMNCMP